MGGGRAGRQRPFGSWCPPRVRVQPGHVPRGHPAFLHRLGGAPVDFESMSDEQLRDLIQAAAAVMDRRQTLREAATEAADLATRYAAAGGNPADLVSAITEEARLVEAEREAGSP